MDFVIGGGSQKCGHDIRVCVDMHQANKAVFRERHPIPTIEELLHDLSGSTLFSKTHLKRGFHRILLGEKVATSLPLSHTKVSLQVLDVWSDISTGGIPADQ